MIREVIQVIGALLPTPHLLCGWFLWFVVGVPNFHPWSREDRFGPVLKSCIKVLKIIFLNARVVRAI